MNGDGGEEVELLGEDKKEAQANEDDELEMEMGSQLPRAIGFFEAWRLPGVAPFAFCLFFSKLVAYTFLYWLPFYIRNNGMQSIAYTLYYLIDLALTMVGYELVTCT